MCNRARHQGYITNAILKSAAGLTTSGLTYIDTCSCTGLSKSGLHNNHTTHFCIRADNIWDIHQSRQSCFATPAQCRHACTAPCNKVKIQIGKIAQQQTHRFAFGVPQNARGGNWSQDETKPHNAIIIMSKD